MNIEKLKNRLRHYRITQCFINLRDRFKLRHAYHSDYRFYLQHNLTAKRPLDSIKYSTLLHCHVLEKGMSHSQLRKFGEKHTSIILQNLRSLDPDSFEYRYAIETLSNYLSLYQAQGWQDDPNYLAVNNYLQKASRQAPPSVNYITLSSINASHLDYSSFLESRHSVRKFQQRKLTKTDITTATKAASFTPSACNRQFCKIYQVSTPSKKSFLAQKIQGLSGFDLPSSTLFVITYNQNALLGPHERNQGFFNAGLFAMNFVNALHSLGIGSCLLQCGNSLKEEAQIKSALGIPANQRIAVFLAAGYYPEKIQVLRSKRKSPSSLFTTL